MKTIDIGAYFLVYDFIVGVLMMLASEKIGVYAGKVNKAYGPRLSRVAYVSVFTFGACVTLLSGSIYLAPYMF